MAFDRLADIQANLTTFYEQLASIFVPRNLRSGTTASVQSV